MSESSKPATDHLPMKLSLPVCLDRFTGAALALALALRLFVTLVVMSSETTLTGDSAYYQTIALDPARLIFRPHASVTSVGPIYPLFLIPFFNLIPTDAPVLQIAAVRLAQSVLDTVTVGLVYLIAHHLFDRRVARLALIVQALDLRYAFQAGRVTTETLFIMLFAGFMLIYLAAASGQSLRKYRLAGLLLGIAILTRPVPLLFPALLLVHAWFHPNSRRQAMQGLAWLSAIATLVILPWLVRTVLIDGEFVPIADTFYSHFWQSTRPDGRELGSTAYEQAVIADTGSEAVGATDNAQFLAAAIRNILSAPGQWIGRLALDTLRAYAQPYPTLILISPSAIGARDILRDFWAGKASLIDVLTIPGLWRRAAMYLWHYWGLLAGLLGLILAWPEHRWQVFPLPAWIAYTTGVTALLLIEPRYIFPVMFAFTILASYATLRIYDALRRPRPD